MQDTASELPLGDRLDSWKDIAAYLRREVRTVQLWEKNEGLPVHRHAHQKRGTVYAHKSELNAWWNGRRAALQGNNPAAAPAAKIRWKSTLGSALLLLCAAVWAGMAVLRWLSPPAEAPRVVPLTTYPGNEMGAGFSPDGNQMAFAWKPERKRDFDIYVKVVGSDRSL